MLSLSDITLFSLSLSSGDRLFISAEASLLSAARFILSRLNFPPVSVAKENCLEYFDALEAYAVNGNLEPFSEMIAGLEKQRLEEYVSAAEEQVQKN